MVARMPNTRPFIQCDMRQKEKWWHTMSSLRCENHAFWMLVYDPEWSDYEDEWQTVMICDTCYSPELAEDCTFQIPVSEAWKQFEHNRER